MSDYKKMYYVLFNAITDAARILRTAQREAEEIYLTSDAGADDPGIEGETGGGNKKLAEACATVGIR